MSLSEVIQFYKESDNSNKHEILYKAFLHNATVFNNGILNDHFNKTFGYGDLAFSWSWYLLISDMPINFKFLEIGVYKGRILSVIQLLSNVLNKNASIFGITPLNISADKFSCYDEVDYLEEIKKSYSVLNLTFENTTIIEGYSQDDKIINLAKENEQYDIIFIDGCHDYEIVCLDIENYSKLLKKGGYLILDDSSSLLDGAYGSFLGHYDVAKAAQDVLENNNNFLHLYAVGHNRIWKKLV
jgi:hypothetical protein